MRSGWAGGCGRGTAQPCHCSAPVGRVLELAPQVADVCLQQVVKAGGPLKVHGGRWRGGVWSADPAAAAGAQPALLPLRLLELHGGCHQAARGAVGLLGRYKAGRTRLRRGEVPEQRLARAQRTPANTLHAWNNASSEEVSAIERGECARCGRHSARCQQMMLCCNTCCASGIGLL